jgi:hypothetical protein
MRLQEEVKRKRHRRRLEERSEKEKSERWVISPMTDGQ